MASVSSTGINLIMLCNAYFGQPGRPGGWSSPFRYRTQPTTLVRPPTTEVSFESKIQLCGLPRISVDTMGSSSKFKHIFHRSLRDLPECAVYFFNGGRLFQAAGKIG